MKITEILAAMGCLTLLAGPLRAATGEAKIKGTAEGSSISGLVQLEDTKGGLKVSADLESLSPGDHGFHIHEFGSCAEMGKKAGDHYNPLGHPHGHVIKDGLKKAHAGDMGNITVGEDGKGHLESVIPGISLAHGKYTVGGRAVIVHEKKDDFGQPTGNAGGRVGCGPIIITGK